MNKILPIILFLTCSCSTRKATLPDGRVLYQSGRFGTKEQIKHVEFRSAQGDVFVLDGYASDQVEALGVVTEAAVKAAVSSMVPVPSTRSGPPAVPSGFKLVPKDDPSTPHMEVE